jgi:hypothetical protein
MTATTIHLYPHMFGEKERTLVEHGPFSASVFRSENGVCGLRLGNGAGELVMLPFQGQQIWSATFDGRNLTMQSMFDQPRPTRTYLETYGAFLLHCGFLSMGVPDPAAGDSHPLHGELPNAPYTAAYLALGEDHRGQYLSLGGRYRHTVAFSANYEAEPVVTLYAGESRFTVDMAITNLKRTPMHYMYMAHVNFRPVDNGRLICTAPSDPDHVRVRTKIPTHVAPTPEYLAFLAALQAEPAQHEVLKPGLAFDPEMVFYLDYMADGDGWAHTMQLHPDGSADYIAHRPAQLDHGVRWICRTPDQDALGMVLPATAEPEGLAAEKAKGHLKSLAGGETFVAELEIGVLDGAEAEKMARKIGAVLNR